MSERDIDAVSADTHLIDAKAVLDAAGVDQVIVNADGTSILATSTAIRMAVDCPERVSHVVLEAPFETTAQLSDTPFGRTGAKLAELDWNVYTETLFRILLAVNAPAIVESYVAMAHNWVEPGVGLRYIREWEAVDLGDILPQVARPTLITRNDPCFVPVRCSQRVAAKIPGARFRQYSDPTYAKIAELIAEFVGIEPWFSGRAEREMAIAPTGTGMTAILFADIVDSTALTERLGDTAFRAKARELGPALRALIREHGGTPVEGPTLGDGILATFTSARAAIGAALRCAEAAEALGLSLHLGIHAGDVSREKDPDGRSNVYGGAVNIAARISGLSAAGQVLVSETVRSLARTSAGVRFEDRGERELKGVGEAVRVWAVRPLDTPADAGYSGPTGE
jgi:class 3 adenylate cyclase